MGVITGNYLPANSKMKNKIHKHIKMWAFTWNPSRVVTENANKSGRVRWKQRHLIIQFQVLLFTLQSETPTHQANIALNCGSQDAGERPCIVQTQVQVHI